MTELTPILRIKDLETLFSTQRGSVKALNKISFAVYPGEIVAIVGESGSGKSVTALSILRLLNTSTANVTANEAVLDSSKFGKVNLFDLSEKQMEKVRGKDVSIIFQDPMSSLNPVITCGKQVAEVLKLHTSISSKEAKKRTIELLNRVKLPNPERIYGAYPHEISGGQKQRVMIAMAMACSPTLIIADEPTTSLDVTVQAHILDLIDEIRVKDNTAVLFITHDLAVVSKVADRILIMHKGKIVEEGSVLEIFENPKHPYTRGLLACRPSLNTDPESLLPTISDYLSEDKTFISKETESHPLKYRSIPKSHHSITDTRPILELKDLKVYFPVKSDLLGRTVEVLKAVDGISLKVYAGETIGLVGESGCGKTTLGRAMLRLIDSTSGSIYYFGQDVTDFSYNEIRSHRKNFQIVFQDPYTSLNPLYTIGDAIMEPMYVHKLYSTTAEYQSKALELLDKVGLSEESFYRYPHEFSGGQRQRICIARALALNPKCIVCDEAVSSLDVSVQAQVLNLLNRLKREFNITYIFITHDLSVAKYMSDRILVMEKGKIIEEGTSEEVFVSPKQSYTRALIKAIPKVDLQDMLETQEKRGRRNAD